MYKEPTTIAVLVVEGMNKDLLRNFLDVPKRLQLRVEGVDTLSILLPESDWEPARTQRLGA